MKQLHLSCIVDLPDDVFAAAEATAKLRQPWAELLAALKEADVKHIHKHETLETRAKTEPKKRGPRVNGAVAAVKPAADTTSLV